MTNFVRCELSIELGDFVTLRAACSESLNCLFIILFLFKKKGGERIRKSIRSGNNFGRNESFIDIVWAHILRLASHLHTIRRIPICAPSFRNNNNKNKVDQKPQAKLWVRRARGR